MKELTLRTTGNFMLLDRFSGREIPATGSATVPYTPFIQERLDNGDLELVEGELPEQEDETPEEPEIDPDLTEPETPPAAKPTGSKPGRRSK